MATQSKNNISEIIDKLQDAVSKRGLKGHFGTANSTGKIELFEKAFGVRLPRSYKLFLRNFDGGFIADDEADHLIMMDEFDEAENIRTHFLSIDEMIVEYERLDIQDWNRPDWFEGFYPYIPFCITAEGEKLIFIDQSLQDKESKIFAAFHDAPASGWYVASESFPAFLNDFYNTGGNPDIFSDESTEYAEEHLQKLNERKEEKKDPLGIIKRCTAYLSLYPESSITYNERANAYVDSKQYEKALSDYNKSIELDPKIALAYHCRGEMFLSLGKARQALIDFDSACQLEPNDPLYLVGRADAFFALNKLDKALADCNLSLDIDGRDFSALSTRHKVYQTLGETEKAAVDEALINELLEED